MKAENFKMEIDIEETGIKEENEEEILPSSTVEETCTVYIKEEDVKTESKGKCNEKNIFFYWYEFRLYL